MKWLGADNVTFVDGWTKRHNGRWRYGNGNNPVMAIAHHTAGGDSKDPNGCPGVVQYVIHRSTRVPYANAVIDSDGHTYICSAGPVWHAGRGSFKGVDRFARLNVPDDKGNDYFAGVEVVSKGQKKDFTTAQKKSLGLFASAMKEATGWKGYYMRLPNHKTWAPKRKVDSKYKLSTLRAWAAKYGIG